MENKQKVNLEDMHALICSATSLSQVLPILTPPSLRNQTPSFGPNLESPKKAHLRGLLDANFFFFWNFWNLRAGFGKGDMSHAQKKPRKSKQPCLLRAKLWMQGVYIGSFPSPNFENMQVAMWQHFRVKNCRCGFKKISLLHSIWEHKLQP